MVLGGKGYARVGGAYFGAILGVYFTFWGQVLGGVPVRCVL